MEKAFRFVSKNKGSLALALVSVGGVAGATGPYDSITAAVDWTTVAAAITAIAALKAAPLVVSVGSKMVLRMIGR